jgi:hypothetical protein
LDDNIYIYRVRENVQGEFFDGGIFAESSPPSVDTGRVCHCWWIFAEAVDDVVDAGTFAGWLAAATF